MFWRQLLQRLRETSGEFFAACGLEGITLFGPQSLLFIFSLFATQQYVTSFTPPQVDCQVCCDSIEPSREAGARFEFLQILVRPYEGFLRKFDRIILIVHDREGNVSNSPLVSLNQHSEGL